MTATMTPVTFTNREGLRLFGIVHTPTRQQHAETAILLLSPGVKMRVAPHRLYNKMTEHFLQLGYTVFRFDFHALGDSEGQASEESLADFYGAVQLGRYVDDTIAAMDWMQATHGTSRFIASGLCGGALTGLLAAETDPRIISLMGVSIPVILDGSNVDKSRHLTAPQLQGTRRRYLRKLRVWDPGVWRSWRRFLTFQSHYSLIYRTMPRASLTKFGLGGSQSETKDTNLNPRFAPAFMRMVSSSRPVLLVFGGADRLRSEFEHKFMAIQRPALEPYTDWYEVHVVGHANHIFSFEEWQRDLTGLCCRWLIRHESSDHGAVLVHGH